MKTILNGIIINPIIPVWIMAIICGVLLFFKKKGVWGYVRQILIILCLFIINLRIMQIDESQQIEKPELNASVLFVLDDTLSMLADDAGNDMNRLESAKNDIEYIMNELEGASFALVTFGNEARINGPFTKDATFIKNVLGPVYPLESFYAHGTSLDVCREYTIDVIKRAKAKELDDGEEQKVILFLISDGEVTSDKEQESFKKLADYVDGGAVLGYGTEKGGTMLYYDRFFGREEMIKDSNYDDAVSHMDPDNLKKISKEIGIEYVHMKNTSDIDDVIKGIKDDVLVLKGDEKALGYKDTYYYFVLPIILLLAIDFISRKRNKI